ncbi:MAG TPA: hypothetical protein VFT74_15175 [Isosphaeraceae bacterium]|nr:hypothetical protein [Isosphaeraceae bacterium]
MPKPGEKTIPKLAMVGILGLLLVVALVWEYRRTQPVRGAVRSFSALVTAANRGEIETVRELCSQNYLRTHRLEKAPEGGVVGFPRNIHKNFQTWTRDSEVWICSGNRLGPVYRMIPERGRWVFDGLEGFLNSDSSGGPTLMRGEP